ncbi:diphosphomevalonate decarboxylase [Patiriisocius marinistellae]|uniref:Diphosphomevalonate decarboxylase n=1 Tax=Patiriisocius marinistellae TaxID=2494560 RepID=A0A5J4FZY4_9FLAO|nr:diphosphomevalonate decarboxylase [Patiriisocius marinistellae]GEQ85301.1 diphosphomevalonate decarboxylase [Patiriisocius marinistellae]
MTEAHFIPTTYSNTLNKGTISCQSPSNIALVKYWGKYGEQMPQNASVSFTLNACHTKTTMKFEKKQNVSNFDFEVYLDGKRELGFEPKILKFFERVEKYIPFLKSYSFKIETTNSFPHSSGIASSASGMSALAVCLVNLETYLSGSELLKGELEIKLDTFSLSEKAVQKASFLARLGSGSAARSIEGPLVVWGEHPQIKESSNLFGTKYNGVVHPNFSNYQDTILLVDKGEKQVSSTVGHDLMHNHPYAAERFKEADSNLSKLIAIFKSGDISAFIKIVESEALQLHAMMMASQPYFILMKPNTLEIINRIWQYRNETKSNICFTLDAGANVHILYPETEKAQVQKFIKVELSQFCKNGEFIHDSVGMGAKSF